MTMFESKIKALEELREEYREVKDALNGYIHKPLMGRGVMKVKRSGTLENIFEITEEDDETPYQIL
jgi:hypothetical protein